MSKDLPSVEQLNKLADAKDDDWWDERSEFGALPWLELIKEWREQPVDNPADDPIGTVRRVEGFDNREYVKLGTDRWKELVPMTHADDRDMVGDEVVFRPESGA